MNCPKLFKSKIFLSLVIFFSVFLMLAFCIGPNDIWFGLDDLGSIIKGSIRNFNDFIRVFSTDCRDYITPHNYNFSKPNFISTLYRPMQNVFFSFIHLNFGLNAYCFYLVNVFFHAINSVLIFNLFSFFMPLNLSFLAGLLFAFYRNVSWLTWISVLQNPLATFFLLITIFLYRFFLLKEKYKFLKYLSFIFSGIALLLSFLSREEAIFSPAWAFLGIFLFFTNVEDTFFIRIKETFAKTWIFFASGFIYILIRIWAFGFETVSRTFGNLFLRFPFLNKLNFIFVNKTSQINIVTNKLNLETKHISIVNNQSSLVSVKQDCFEVFGQKINLFLNSFWRWTSNVFFIDINSFLNKVFIVFLFIFLILFITKSYEKHKKLLSFLFIGFFVFAWPGFLAYPDPRYINSIYPLIIFIFLLGINFYINNNDKKNCCNANNCCSVNSICICKKTILFLCYFLILLSISRGIYKNCINIKNSAIPTLKYKKNFDLFFEQNSFNKDDNFIVISMPYVSDIQYVFQAYLKNFKLKVCCELFSTLAEKGQMGCSYDYKIKGVKSKIEKICIDNKLGYRFISLDKDHCGWWMTFSFFPQKWSEQEKAYVWTDKIPEVGVWTDFSMGKFLINERLENNVVTDVIFLFDNIWIDKKTIFITWDTFEGKYVVLD